MKTVLILRHGQSRSGDVEGGDHDRGLTPQGERDAESVGRQLQEDGLTPCGILCSSAVRARKTADIVATHCGFEGEIEERGALYLASVEAYFEALRDQDENCQRVLIVGHNPALEMLLASLTGGPQRLSPASLAQVELPIETWNPWPADTRGILVSLRQR